MFNFLQRIGKALMTPIAVLPVAALLLRFGFGDIFTGEAAHIMKSAGESIFANLDLLFGVGIAYGLAKDHDGTAALSGAIGVVTAKSVYTTIDSSVNTGVFVGIIMGIAAGIAYNRFRDVALPDYLGFFSGKRFVAIVTVAIALLFGIAAGYFWPYAQALIDGFSNAIISLGELGTFLYGVMNRALIPLGLHHILNSVFWFQLGEYHYLKEGVDTVANGDLTRFFAGDKSAGIYMAGFYPVMMFGLPAMAAAIYLRTKKALRKKAAAILFGVAFTSFLTGITEPMEFLFMFAAPPLYLMHALLTGISLATAQALEIHAGFGFSAGAIDYLINYPLATKPLWLLGLGVVVGAIYFIASYWLIGKLGLHIMENELTKEEKNEQHDRNETDAFIAALGGAENIVDTDACITRLRMQVTDSDAVDEAALTALGAKGVVRPDKHSVQVVLGPKAEKIADSIKHTLSR